MKKIVIVGAGVAGINAATKLVDKEPITDTAPIIYTAKEDGVLPAYNITTDYRDWETMNQLQIRHQSSIQQKKMVYYPHIISGQTDSI